MAGSSNLLAEIWIDAIQENVFEDNAYWNKSQDHSQWIDNKTVHVPNAGNVPVVQQNPTVYPLPTTQRVDNSLDYNIDQYAALPWFVTDLELIQIRYDKVKSLTYAMSMQLKETIGNILPYKWANGISGNAAKIVFTSGSATASMLPVYAGSIATGIRKAPQLSDIAAIKALMDNDFMPSEGRCGLLPAIIFDNGVLGLSNIIINSYYDYRTPVVPDGKPMPIFGFELFVRPNVLYTNASGVLVTYSTSTGLPSSPATTDCAAGIFWHPTFVAKAQGETKVFYQPDRPEYQGDLMSAYIMFGGSYLRTDGKGVYLLVAA